MIWVGLPPMAKADYSDGDRARSARSSGSRCSRGGARVRRHLRPFVDDDGNYTPTGPDLNGNQVQMRKDDGIHFTAAGADKLAFYVSQTIKLYYRGGGGVGHRGRRCAGRHRCGADGAAALSGARPDAAAGSRGRGDPAEPGAEAGDRSGDRRRAAASGVRHDADDRCADGRVDAFGVGKAPEPRRRPQVPPRARRAWRGWMRCAQLEPSPHDAARPDHGRDRRLDGRQDAFADAGGRLEADGRWRAPASTVPIARVACAAGLAEGLRDSTISSAATGCCFRRDRMPFDAVFDHRRDRPDRGQSAGSCRCRRC